MIKMKLPSGKELSVSTSPGDTMENKEAKASSEKSDTIFNIHGGNNLIAPTASQAEQKLVEKPADEIKKR